MNESNTLLLPRIGSWSPSAHEFSRQELDAIEASEITGRPLLIRGEPGLGKSQIARAIAKKNEWPLVTFVVNARTEIDDLLYRVDHVRRLSEAHFSSTSGKPLDKDISDFIAHGPVWRALQLSTSSAEEKPGKTTDCFPAKEEKDTGWYKPILPGCVLLIDEIDKAPSDVPNALLEVLSEMGFLVNHTGEPIRGNRCKLRVVITANDERDLPAAFVRRCAALQVSLGKDPRKRLYDIAHAHIQSNLLPDFEHKVLEYAADCVMRERERVETTNYRPGTSEYLDLLKVAAAYAQRGMDDEAIVDVMKKMQAYLVKKTHDQGEIN